MATTQKNGGAARAAALSPERRSEIAKTAATARYQQHTLFEKLAPARNTGTPSITSATAREFQVLGTPGIRRLGQRIFEGSLQELTGREGMKRLREMADLDPIIGASLLIFKLLLRDAEFKVYPASDNDAPGVAPEVLRERAAFIDQAFGDMEGTFDDSITDACTMFWAGWAYLEEVYKYRRGPQPQVDVNPITGALGERPAPSSKFNDGLVGWRMLALRGQQTLWDWVWDEETGQAVAWRQQDVYSTKGNVILPLAKGLHFRTESTKNNPEGWSMLTHAYTTYKLVKRLKEVEAIGIVRNLNGVPVVRIPANVASPTATAEDASMRAHAETMVYGLCVDDGAGLVLPSSCHPESGKYDWDVELLGVKGGTTGAAELAQRTITRYDHRLGTTTLTAFLLLGQDQVGTQALAENNTDMLLMSINAVASSICDAFNRQAIPRLITANGWPANESPQLKCQKIKRAPSLAEISQYISALSGAGIVVGGNPETEATLLDAIGAKPPAEEL